MKDLLVISPYVPYDSVAHAGGKTHNYYLKFINNSKEFRVRLLSFYNKLDLTKLDFNEFNLEKTLIHIDPPSNRSALWKTINIESRRNPLNRHANILPNFMEYKVITAIKQMKEEGYSPDFVLLEWTQMVVLAPKIRRIFSDAKIIASEHDVTFLGFERRYKYEDNLIKKIIKKFRFNKMMKLELDVLNNCDLVVTHNEKDMKLLLKHGIKKEKQHVIVPFYMNMTQIYRKNSTKDIVFFGAMDREENYLSAIWFIENVFYLLDDKEIRFIILGGNPHKSLLNYASERIIVTGFVDDISEYFSTCLCMVAPLVIGAGIKVKVLESMSAGVPTLTNSIGIEGIPAIDRLHYIHCTDPKDYVDAINGFLNGSIDSKLLYENTRTFFKENFNLEKSAAEYLNRIKNIK